MRVALYAEGSRELGASAWVATTAARAHVVVGTALPERAWGAAHHLVSRAVTAPVEFVAPLLLSGRRPSGSDLLVEKNLVRLCTWPVRAEAPDAFVFIVDGDGDGQRRRRLQQAVQDRPGVVVGVAREAFEAWLLADLDAVRSVLQVRIDDLGDVERMPASSVKERLDGLLAESGRGAPEAIEGARAQIARALDLHVASQRSRSLADFRGELSRL
jgi:hypothetical protein